MLYVIVKKAEPLELFIAKCKSQEEARRLAGLDKDSSVYGMLGQGELESLITNPLVFAQLTLHSN